MVPGTVAGITAVMGAEGTGQARGEGLESANSRRGKHCHYYQFPSTKLKDKSLLELYIFQAISPFSRTITDSNLL